MKTNIFVGAVLLTAVTACGKSEHPAEPAANEAQLQQAAEVHSATGTVESISGDRVTIAHGPVASIGWPAMSMAFVAPSGTADGVTVGDEVEFSFHQDGSTYVLSSLSKR